MPENALQVYPPPTTEIPPDTIHQHLQIIPSSKCRNPELPYTIANMVASADGRAAAGGKASGIGSSVDRLVMRNLRAQADAVMVGAGTVRAERLSLGLDETFPGPQPMAVILTVSGDLPLHTNLVAHEGQDVLVISPDSTPQALAEPPGGGAELLRVPVSPDGYPDLPQALRTLKREYGVETLLVEGGPRLNGALISDGLLDEIFLTVAPKLLGGATRDVPNIVEGALPKPTSLRLLSIHVAADEVFLRYSLQHKP